MLSRRVSQFLHNIVFPVALQAKLHPYSVLVLIQVYFLVECHSAYASVNVTSNETVTPYKFLLWRDNPGVRSMHLYSGGGRDSVIVGLQNDSFNSSGMGHPVPANQLDSHEIMDFDSVGGHYHRLEYPGELGSGVVLEEVSLQQQTEISEGYEKYGFNLFVSNMIPHNRTLPDFRSEGCQRAGITYPRALLPKASVIITFHNEPLSTLMRTLCSVLDRSSEFILREIVLINDFSRLEPNLNLEKLVPTSIEVKVINHYRREGVARARTMGAVNAKGPVLIFLDSHVEVTEGWLEPLVYRIFQNEKAVVAPTVDILDANTFQYKASNGTFHRVGLFNWNLQVKRVRARDALLKNLSSPTEPLQTAVIPFGMVAVHKDFFEAVGHFDTEFETFGGESLELSFKAWMCGGKVEVSPCSHVGHLFKGDQPPEHLTAMNKNLVRLAASWMGPHSKYYYEMATHSNGYSGNVSSRLEIGLALNCRPFSWYLENIAPEVFNPDLSVGEGEVKNVGFGGWYCLDARADTDSVGKIAGVWPCHYTGGNQYWHYSNLGELRRVDLCLDSNSNSHVIMYYCHRKSESQKWQYDFKSQLMHHPFTTKCLSMNANSELYLETCDFRQILQRWDFDFLNHTRLTNMLANVFNITESIT